MEVRVGGRLRRLSLLAIATEDQHDIEEDEVGDESPLQDLAGSKAGGVGTDDAAGNKSDPEHDQPAQWAAAAVFPIAPDARQTRRRDLRHQRYALRHVLFHAKQEHGEDHQSASWADAEQSRSEPTRKSCADA